MFVHFYLIFLFYFYNDSFSANGVTCIVLRVLLFLVIKAQFLFLIILLWNPNLIDMYIHFMLNFLIFASMMCILSNLSIVHFNNRIRYFWISFIFYG